MRREYPLGWECALSGSALPLPSETVRLARCAAARSLQCASSYSTPSLQSNSQTTNRLLQTHTESERERETHTQKVTIINDFPFTHTTHTPTLSLSRARVCVFFVLASKLLAVVISFVSIMTSRRQVPKKCTEQFAFFKTISYLTPLKRPLLPTIGIDFQRHILGAVLWPWNANRRENCKKWWRVLFCKLLLWSYLNRMASTPRTDPNGIWRTLGVTNRQNAAHCRNE